MTLKEYIAKKGPVSARSLAIQHKNYIYQLFSHEPTNHWFITRRHKKDKEEEPWSKTHIYQDWTKYKYNSELLGDYNHTLEDLNKWIAKETNQNTTP